MPELWENRENGLPGYPWVGVSLVPRQDSDDGWSSVERLEVGSSRAVEGDRKGYKGVVGVIYVY